MRELAACELPQPIGCTQVTEINYTVGVELVGVLPTCFELATVYSAAVATRAAQPELAARFIALLSGPETLTLRAAGGFEA
jgi:molybdate transport system substrate-binding protein